MGIAERDYMRRRDGNVRAFGPKEPSAASTLWIVLFWIVFALGCYKAITWWQGSKTPRPTITKSTGAQEVKSTPAVTKAPAHPALTGNWDPNRSLPSLAPPAAVSSSTALTVTKCVVNGVTTYSDGPCAPAAKVSRVTINPTQNMSDGYRPPPSFSRAAPQITAQAAPQRESGPSIHEVRIRNCGLHDAAIKQIDARARQPISGGEQDRLASERKKHRDEQFRLRC